MMENQNGVCFTTSLNVLTATIYRRVAFSTSTVSLIYFSSAFR